MADGEQGHILHHMTGAIEKEDDPHQKQQMVVAGDHVLCAQIDEREHRRALDSLDEAGVPPGYGMGGGKGGE